MKIKVGVFFGGKSTEHEISVISAIQAINAFDTEKYDIIPVYISKDNKMYVGEKIANIEEYSNIDNLISNSSRVVLINNNEKHQLIKYPFKKFGNNVYDYIDIAFPIVHGTNVEDGTLQGYFKMMSLPFVGCDVISSAVGMDKYVMKTVLRYNNIPVLDCMRFTSKDYNEGVDCIINKIEQEISYPVIVKPINLGSSIGIKIAKNTEQLSDALDYAFKFSGKILVEKAIVNLKEINCSVIGDYADEMMASECEEPINNDEILSYEDKYMSGGKKTGSKGMSSLQRKLPADISKELKKDIQDMAIATFKALGCSGVSRIDFIVDTSDNKIYVNEINTIPGSLSFYLWNETGIKYNELLDRVIKSALNRDREERNIMYSFDTNILSNFSFGGTKGSKI